MREIKFRVWNDYTNEMRYNFEGFTNKFDVLNLTKFFNKENYLTLLQFTGLQDVDGKDIYEGDIILIESNKCLCPVEYSENDCRFLLKNGRGYRGYFAMIGDLKIVGNIYENSELLEQGGGLRKKVNL